MKHRLQSIISVCLFGLPLSAFAIEAPQLPSSAKKLSAQEIVELQDGVPLTYQDFTADALMTGTVVHDFKNNKHSGTYNYQGIQGQFSGKIWMKDDMFCHEEGRGFDTCGFVYSDGSAFYNVGTDGKVLSIDKK